jgi:hypothetical protein
MVFTMPSASRTIGIPTRYLAIDQGPGGDDGKLAHRFALEIIYELPRSTGWVEGVGI